MHSHSNSQSSHRQRPSVSRPIAWLAARASSVGPHPAPKPVRISEPRLHAAYHLAPPQRARPLGSGATVVRTPQDALARPASEYSEDSGEGPAERRKDEQPWSPVDKDLPSPPMSPPLRPTMLLTSQSTPHLPLAHSSVPPCPSRAPPSPPPPEQTMPSVATTIAPLRPSLKRASESLPAAISPPVPALPFNIPAVPPPARFAPVLLSSLPPAPVRAEDAGRIVVTLETGTQTHRTTLATLLSRPSFLADWLADLLGVRNYQPLRIQDPRLSEMSSGATLGGTESGSERETASDAPESPTDSEFHSIFQNHLAAAGLLHHPSVNSLHIFLDRPSPPYDHVLAYLRSPPSDPATPAVLPRGVQPPSFPLPSSSSAAVAHAARLDALLALRDEARFLGLAELQRLCADAVLRARTSAAPEGGRHRRGASTASASSSAASVRSAQTWREREKEREQGAAHWYHPERVSHHRAHSRAADVLETPEENEPALVPEENGIKEEEEQEERGRSARSPIPRSSATAPGTAPASADDANPDDGTAPLCPRRREHVSPAPLGPPPASASGASLRARGGASAPPGWI